MTLPHTLEALSDRRRVDSAADETKDDDTVDDALRDRRDCCSTGSRDGRRVLLPLVAEDC